jgi:hypothetical protein
MISAGGDCAHRSRNSKLITISDTLLPFEFPMVARKKVTAALDGGRITSDGRRHAARSSGAASRRRVFGGSNPGWPRREPGLGNHVSCGSPPGLERRRRAGWQARGRWFALAGSLRVAFTRSPCAGRRRTRPISQPTIAGPTPSGRLRQVRTNTPLLLVRLPRRGQ